jgi:hypothetical protein
MTFAQIAAAAAGTIPVLLFIAAIALPALDERNRRKFASREEMNGMRERLESDISRAATTAERNGNLFVALDDRVGDLEEKAARIEERQTQQWERISEQMASTARALDNAVARVENVTEAQHKLALELERLHRYAYKERGV